MIKLKKNISFKNEKKKVRNLGKDFNLGTH